MTQEAGKSKGQKADDEMKNILSAYNEQAKGSSLVDFANGWNAAKRYAQSREQPWVRVEAALPEIGENVIVYTAYTDKGQPKNDMFCGYMDEYGELFYVSGDADESYGWQFNDCVTHWKPLPPAPPKEI